MNTNLLLAKVTERGIAKAGFPKMIGMSASSWYKKLRGITDFTQQDIIRIAQVLFLSDEDIIRIFFPRKVS